MCAPAQHSGIRNWSVECDGPKAAHPPMDASRYRPAGKASPRRGGFASHCTEDEAVSVRSQTSKTKADAVAAATGRAALKGHPFQRCTGAASSVCCPHDAAQARCKWAPVHHSIELNAILTMRLAPSAHEKRSHSAGRIVPRSRRPARRPISRIAPRAPRPSREHSRRSAGNAGGFLLQAFSPSVARISSCFDMRTG